MPKSAPPIGGPTTADRRLPAGHDPGGGGELALRNDAAQRARLRPRVERSRAPLDERDEHDRPEDDPVEQDQRGEASDGERTDGVGADHHPPTVPAVGCEPGRERQSANGSIRANATRPAFAAEPVNASTSSGYAIVVSCAPRPERSCPVWSSMKSRFRRRGTAVTSRR